MRTSEGVESYSVDRLNLQSTDLRVGDI
jgi:hypothetical protein